MATSLESASASQKKYERDDILDSAKREDKKEESLQKRQFDALVQEAVSKLRSAMMTTESITSRDISDYEALSYSESGWNRIGKHTYEERIDVLRTTIRESIPEMIEETRSLEQKFQSDLAMAVSKGWINKESASGWEKRLKSDNTTHWEKASFMKDTFPGYLKNWKDVAEERDSLLKLAEKSGITAKDISALRDLQNQDAFLSLHYESRKDRVAKVHAFILAHREGKTVILEAIQDTLEAGVKGGYLHSSKVGQWMKRAMKSGNPEKFLETVLQPFMLNWKAARADFDKLNVAMDKQGIPRGFRPVKADNFLRMDYKQRTSYNALAWLRLKDMAEADTRMASLKLRIRHNLDTQDWEGAEDELKKALALRSDDPELQSMQTFLECHREEAEEKEEQETTEKIEQDPAPLLQNIRSMLSQVPAGTLRTLYTKAFEAGPAVANRFLQVSANHAWVVEHGYASEAENIQNARDEYNKEKTREYATRGHSMEMERNIVNGDTATEDAIRDDCTKAQMLYVGDMGTEAVITKVKANADNESFGYWTTLVPIDANFGLHNRVIKDLHWPLKKSLRELDKMGYRFTVAGSPSKKAA